MDQDSTRILAGIWILLGVSWIAGGVLKLQRRHRELALNVIARTRAWTLMIALLTAAVFLGSLGVTLLFAGVSVLALREYLSVAGVTKTDRRAAVWIFALFLPLQYALIVFDWYGLFSILIPVYAFAVLTIRQVLSGDVADFLARAAKLHWGLMLCVYCISHVPALGTLVLAEQERSSAIPVLFLLVCVQLGDVFQYVFGKWLGRRKVAPSISPGKTWEGLVGGVGAATIIGALLSPFTIWAPTTAAALACGLALCGFFGDLAMSAIKRDRGVKDFGTLLEGHGGVLDRIDSLCFAAPVFFHIVRYFWT
ncbi:MAG: phosphatidate cytidylyltransferase [Candidatus Sumerlaeia bacterium]|nr:phosphatidate cytidylyltransferase [Candidatus Sumerlaeia bacterium]